MAICLLCGEWFFCERGAISPTTCRRLSRERLEEPAVDMHGLERRNGHKRKRDDPGQHAFMIELSAFEGMIGALVPGFGRNPHDTNPRVNGSHASPDRSRAGGAMGNR